MLDQGWLEMLLDFVRPVLAVLSWPKRGTERSQMTGCPHTRSGTSTVGLDTGVRLSAARGIRPGGQCAYFFDLPCSMVPCRNNIFPVLACSSTLCSSL